MASDDVYAKELFKCGKGYPLWQPQATEDDVEVQLGDVGYLDKGGFCRLFNACNDKDHDLNNKPNRVPKGFEKFAVDLSPKKTPCAVDGGPLLSRSVKSVGSTTGLAIHGARVNFEFECVDNQGACILVGAPAPRAELHQARRMKAYMKKNIDAWVGYATEDLGMEKKMEDILFVRGWVKTTHWAVFAFVDRARNAKVTVSGGFSSIADVSLGLEIKKSSSSVDHHTGPGGRQIQVPQNPSPQNANNRNKRRTKNRDTADIVSISRVESKPDQCIFLHYFKMKRRLVLPAKIEAAAEPQDGSPSNDDDDYEFEEAPAPKKAYDPVDYVLDYILKYSEASEAIGSDSDILELCKNNEPSEYPIPDDIPAFLESVRPEIEVSDGLGMLRFDDAITMELIAESAALAQQNTQNPPNAEETSPEQEAASPPIPDANSQGQAGPDDSAGTAGHGQESDNDDPPDDDINMEGDPRDSSRGEGEKKIVDFSQSDSLLQMPTGGDPERKGGVFALAYSPAGNRVAAGFEDNTVLIWDGENRQLLHTLVGHEDAICSLAFSPDGSQLVTGSRDNLVIIWDAVNGYKLKALQGHDGFVNCVAYSPDGRMFASASVDSTVKLWNADGTEHMTTEGHEAMVMSVAFSADSRHIVSASAEGIAFLWDTVDGQRTGTLHGHEGVIYSTAFSPDSQRLVTSSDDGSAKVWGTVSGDEFMTLREHQGSVWAAVFSADGRYVLSVGSERTVKICDSYSAELIDTIDGGDDLANAATFSGNGKYIAAGGEDHTISVWNTETRRRIRQFSGHRDNINRITFSPDNKRLVSASDDGTVRIWTLPPEVAQPAAVEA